MPECDMPVNRIMSTEKLDQDDFPFTVKKIVLQKKLGELKFKLEIQGKPSDIEDFFEDVDLSLNTIITVNISQKQKQISDFKGE